MQIDADERLSLAPEAVAVLADEGHPAFGMGSFHHLPQTMAALERLPESFRTGLGLDYDAHGPDYAEGIARGFEPWIRANLLPTVLPALDEVEAKLRAGATVLDVGCGAGGVVLVLAEAFPASRVTGYDISQHALDRARERQAEAGVTNATFADPRQDPMPADGSADLVVTFDCLHDMTDPAGMVRAIRAAVADDGTWLLVDIKAQDTFAENVERNPMASLMYGISVISCMTQPFRSRTAPAWAPSASQRPWPSGSLGTPASPASSALEIDHPINALYEIRP